MKDKDTKNNTEMLDTESVLSLEEMEAHESDLKKKSVKKLFPNYIYNNLPTLLKKGCNILVDTSDKEAFLVGALAIVSGILPNIKGYYGAKDVYPNLFVYILGKYGTGKGILKYCHELALPIHKKLRHQAEMDKDRYKQEMKDYKKDKTGMIGPPEPILNTMLYIPANNTKAGILRLFQDNGGKGILFETEADTLNDAVKKDAGGFSDMLRKAASHETINSFRKGDSEYIEVNEPKISTLLSSTSDQLRNLIPSIQNGLFSRFLYYELPTTKEFKNPFNKDKRKYPKEFETLSNRFLKVYETLLVLPEPIFIELSETQQERFNGEFAAMKQEIMEYVSEDLQGTVNRLGLICFRIIMILTTLRFYDVEFGFKDAKILVCHDKDFETALKLSQIFKEIALQVFYSMPEGKSLDEKKEDKKENETIKMIKKAKALKAENVSYLEIAKKLRISKTTAYNYANKNDV